ncbi:MAG: hypothetical protein ACLTJ8_04010 [Veillonella atypica]
MTTVPRILTIQDMSSIGRCCSLTVMLPIISVSLECQADTNSKSSCIE